MDVQLQERCRLLLENRDRMKKAFTWESGLMHLACAGIYTSEGKLAEPEQTMACKAVAQTIGRGVFAILRYAAGSGGSDDGCERRAKGIIGTQCCGLSITERGFLGF